MIQNARISAIGLVLTCAVVAGVSTARAQSGLEREILIQQDLAIPGYQILLADLTVAVGAREGRHSHPGTLVARIAEGELTLEREGQPPIVLRAGDAVLIEPGQVHEGINTGTVPVRALGTFVVEKDKPLATEAP